MSLIGFAKFLPEVVATIERNDDFEIAETFRDLAAHRAKCLEAFHVLAFDPTGNDLSEDQHEYGGYQRRSAQSRVQGEKEYGSTCHHDEVATELHQRLGEELIQFVCIVVDSRDQIARFVLIKKDERQLLQLRKK